MQWDRVLHGILCFALRLSTHCNAESEADTSGCGSCYTYDTDTNPLNIRTIDNENY